MRGTTIKRKNLEFLGQRWHVEGFKNLFLNVIDTMGKGNIKIYEHRDPFQTIASVKHSGSTTPT